MNKAKNKTWGDEFQRHLSGGCDHADAAFRADEWNRIRSGVRKAKERGHTSPILDDLEAALDEIKQLNLRGLEVSRALLACVRAMNPPDRDGISMHEWNQRLKVATKQDAAVFDGSVSEADDG